MTNAFSPLDTPRLAPVAQRYGLELICLSSVDSTNNYLKQWARQTQPSHNAVCVAEQQTAGRGRLQRSWYSPAGENLYFSLLYHFPHPSPHPLATLSLVTGLIVLETLRDLPLSASFPFQIKWPNDIVYAGKKLAGILIELQNSSDHRLQAIIGIGINVNMLADAQQLITQPWISLRQITQTVMDRTLLSQLLIEKLMTGLEIFQQQGWPAFTTRWSDVDSLYQQTVAVEGQAQIVTGIAQGVDAQGRLQVQLADGAIQFFTTGEVRLRVTVHAPIVEK